MYKQIKKRCYYAYQQCLYFKKNVEIMILYLLLLTPTNTLLPTKKSLAMQAALSLMYPLDNMSVKFSTAKSFAIQTALSPMYLLATCLLNSQQRCPQETHQSRPVWARHVRWWAGSEVWDHDATPDVCGSTSDPATVGTGISAQSQTACASQFVRWQRELID